MFAFRKRARSVSPSVLNSTPSSLTRPAVGESKPDNMFRSVVLPDPEGPRIATPSPRRTIRETFWRISRLRAPSQYTLLTPAASILTSPHPLCAGAADEGMGSFITQRLGGVE